MKKRFISVFLSISMILSTIFSASARSVETKYYDDVYSSDSYYKAVNYLHEHEIVNGTYLNHFEPKIILKREQVLCIFWRMLNKPNPVGTVMEFTDCKPEDYYYDAIRWASSSGVALTLGRGDGTFGVDVPITQQEILIFLYRFACYCEYSDNTQSSQSKYTKALNDSSLIYKNKFLDYAKSAAGWAYNYGFIEDNGLNPESGCNRGNAAQYVYKFYQIFQKKYGLSVVNTTRMNYVAPCAPAMKNLFNHCGAISNSYTDITRSQFDDAMRNTFSKAKPLDICYIYCASHGGNSGLELFHGSPIVLSPKYLRSQIELYDGTFVVFVSGCCSGTYVTSNNTANIMETQNDFDANNFVNELINCPSELYAVGKNNLTNSLRIKVLCSSKKGQNSYSTSHYATNYWCLGCGYDYMNNKYIPMQADSNHDVRVSLNELWKYSHDKIYNALKKQNVVCWPNNDNFIIYECSY